MKTREDFLFYQEPGIALYCGDCRDVLPLLMCPNTTYCLEACDGRCSMVRPRLILTDPPYEAEAHTLQRRTNGQRPVVAPIPFDAITEEVRDQVARLLARMAAGWVLTFCQVEAAMIWRDAYVRYGLNYRRACVWVKPDGMPQFTGDRPGMGYETLLAMHVMGASSWNGGGRTGVFTHSKRAGGKHEHPTMKPESLMRELLRLFSNPGDLVVDPFAGSGSTLSEAKRTGRRAIGIEISPEYCEMTVRRLRQEVLTFA